MAEISAQAVQQLREKTGLGLMQCKKALSETSGDIEKAVEFLRKQGAAVAAKRVGKEAKEGRVLVASSESAVAAVEINCETDFVSSSDDFQSFAGKTVQVILEEKPANLDSLTSLPLEGATVGDVTNAVVGKIGEKIHIKRFVVETVGPNEHAETYTHMNGKIGVIVKLGYAGKPENKSGLSTLAKDLAMQVAATSPIAIEPKDVPSQLIGTEKEIYRELTLKEGKSGDVVEKIVEGKVNKFYKENCLISQVFVKDTKLTIDKLLANTAKGLGLDSIRILSFHRLQLGQ